MAVNPLGLSGFEMHERCYWEMNKFNDPPHFICLIDLLI